MFLWNSILYKCVLPIKIISVKKERSKINTEELVNKTSAHSKKLDFSNESRRISIKVIASFSARQTKLHTCWPPGQT